MQADSTGELGGAECRLAQRVLGALIRRNPGRNVVVSPHALAMALSSAGGAVDDSALHPISALLGEDDIGGVRSEVAAAERGLRDKSADNLPWSGWLPPLFHLTTAFSLWHPDDRWPPPGLVDAEDPVRPSLYPVAAATGAPEVRRRVDAWLRDRTRGAIATFDGLGRWEGGDSVVIAAVIDVRVEAAFADTTWAPGADREQMPTEVVSCELGSPSGGSRRGFAASPSFYYADSSGYRAAMMHAEPHAQLHLLLPPEHGDAQLICPPRYSRTRLGNRRDPQLGERTPSVEICYPRWRAATALDLRDTADDLGLSVLFDRTAPVVELKDAADQTPPRARASVASLLSAARFELGPRATINTEKFTRSSGELDVLASRRTNRCAITLAFDRPFFALLTDEITGALLYAAYIRTW